MKHLLTTAAALLLASTPALAQNYCVILTSEITSNSYGSAPLAAPVGTLAVMTFNVSAPGTDQPGTGGAWVNYAMDTATFDLDILGPTGLAFSGPANFGLVNAFPSADGLQGPNGGFTTGQTLSYSMGAVSTLFSTNDITMLVGTYDLAANLTSFGSMIFGNGGFMELFPQTLEIQAEVITWCNGDGGNQLGCTNCPCSNNAVAGTIGGCLNSAGTSASLNMSGSTSVSLPSGDTTDLRFALTGAPANAFTILNSGDAVAPGNPANPCFGLNTGSQAMQFDGLRCAITNTRRHGGRSADAMGEVGNTNSPWGGEGNPMAGIANAGSGFTSGQTRYFQVINRDDPMLSCMRGLNTSQAIEVTFTP